MTSLQELRIMFTELEEPAELVLPEWLIHFSMTRMRSMLQTLSKFWKEQINEFLMRSEIWLHVVDLDFLGAVGVLVLAGVMIQDMVEGIVAVVVLRESHGTGIECLC